MEQTDRAVGVLPGNDSRAKDPSHSPCPQTPENRLCMLVRCAGVHCVRLSSIASVAALGRFNTLLVRLTHHQAADFACTLFLKHGHFHGYTEMTTQHFPLSHEVECETTLHYLAHLNCGFCLAWPQRLTVGTGAESTDRWFNPAPPWGPPARYHAQRNLLAR